MIYPQSPQTCRASKRPSSISRHASPRRPCARPSLPSPASPLPGFSPPQADARGGHSQFTAKQLNRQAAKAGKDETAEKAKLKKAVQQNHADIAKIYAQNAIRKQNEKLNLLRLASRIDAVSSRVQTAVTMRQVTGSMANVVRGMDGAMKAMDLEKVRRGARYVPALPSASASARVRSFGRRGATP